MYRCECLNSALRGLGIFANFYVNFTRYCQFWYLLTAAVGDAAITAKSQILIRTASFLQKFAASENSLCMLFANDARRQSDNIFMQFGDNIHFKLHASYAMLFLLNSSTSHSCC